MYRILLADDHSSIRTIVKSALRSYQYELVEAESAEEAIALLEDGEDVDMIVSDFHMNAMNGLDFLRYVRNSPEYGNLPFIMLSYEEDRRNMLEAYDADVDAWVQKPFQLNHFLKTLDRSIQKRSVMAGEF